MKKKYELTFLHKFVSVALFVMAVFFCCRTDYYHYEFDCSWDTKSIAFLQEGTYIFEIDYVETLEEKSLIIYSDELISDTNTVGVELARCTVGANSGNVQLSVELKQNVYNVIFATSLDAGEECYISHVKIDTVDVQNTDNFLMAVFCVIGAALTILLGLFVPVEKYKEPVALLLLGLAAGMPLYTDYIMWGHDLAFHISRLESIYCGLRAGNFPVYIGASEMGGYGMLSSTMYPELFLYPFAMLRFGKVSLMFCYKLLLVCIHVGCAFAAYYGVKNVCKSWKVAMWATVFYTFSIYRLTNTYFRAALGETLAMVFFPLIIWGIYEVFWGNYKKWYILTLCMCGLLQSHVLSVEMCLCFLILETIIWLISFRKKEYMVRLLAGVKAAIMTILLNMFFWVPFLLYCGEDLQCFNMHYQLSNATASLAQTFSAFPQTQAVNRGLGYVAEVMPHTIGVNLLLGSVLFCIEVWKDKECSTEMQLGKHCLVFGVLAVCMASPLFPWDMIQSVGFLNRIASSIQFAWRFHALASIFLSITAAIGVVRFAGKKSEKNWVYALFAVIVLVGTGYYFETTGNEAMRFADKMAFNGYGGTDSLYLYSNGEAINGYAHLEYRRNNAYIYTHDGTPITYSDYKRNGVDLEVTVQVSALVDDYLVFPIYYYPGYEILIDDEEVFIHEIERRVACELPVGISTIKVRYVGLPVFRVANIVSLLTVVGIVIYMLYMNAYKKKNRKNLKGLGMAA